MPLSIKTEQHGQFIVLITDDIDINHSSLKRYSQNIIVANKYHDILTFIETTRLDLILLNVTANCSELLTRIKDPHGINNNTPIIAIINSAEDSLS
jgi:hypothetical protein